MNENLRNAIESWCRENHADMNDVTDGPVELEWPRSVSNDFGYMSLFSDGSSVVDVQYGTFTDREAREQRGMTRVPALTIVDGLSHVKALVDESKPVSTWIYTPRVDIGSVGSLKFS